MTEAHARCSECGTAMTLQPGDPVFGASGPLKVVLLHLPEFVCVNQHRRFALEDFPRKLLDRVRGEEMAKLPAARKSGWFVFGRCACAGCGAKLRGESEEETFDFDIALEDLPPLRVEMTVPLQQCAACGKAQVRSLAKMRRLVAPAMAQAFRAAGVKPA